MHRREEARESRLWREEPDTSFEGDFVATILASKHPQELKTFGVFQEPRYTLPDCGAGQSTLKDIQLDDLTYHGFEYRNFITKETTIITMEYSRNMELLWLHEERPK